MVPSQSCTSEKTEQRVATASSDCAPFPHQEQGSREECITFQAPLSDLLLRGRETLPGESRTRKESAERQDETPPKHLDLLEVSRAITVPSTTAATIHGHQESHGRATRAIRSYSVC